MFNRFHREQKLNKQTTYFCDIPCKVDEALNALEIIEDYVTQCFDITNIIITKIDELNVDDIVTFDFKSFFPENPNLTLALNA
jgi:hypothetical protein